MRNAGRRRKWLMVVGLALVVAGALATAAIVYFSRKPNDGAFALRAEPPGGADAFANALFQTVGVRMLPGHEVAWSNDGAIFESVRTAVSRAERSVHVVMYIWERGTASDGMIDALAKRAKAGVACRLLIDALGSPDFEKDAKELSR